MSTEPRGAAERPNYRVEALAKGLRILRLFSTDRHSLRLKEVSELSGIPLPTAFRLVATLESEGYLERDATGAIRPGIAVLSLGFASLQGLDLVQAADPILRDLGEKTVQTVNLGVLVDDQVLFVARIEPPFALVAANIHVGSLVPAVYSSIGKILLADLGATDLDHRLAARSFDGARGPRGVRSQLELRRQLEAARRDGFVIQREEANAGLTSVAAPVREAGGSTVAAINLAVSSAEFSDERIRDELVPLLRDACVNLSLRRGWSG